MACEAKGDAMIMEDLSPYDRATVGLWARSFRQMRRQTGRVWVEEAAAHAVLARLRANVDGCQLFARYGTDTNADCALIQSLLSDPPAEEALWRIRDAAFHLRWIELKRQR